jgi:two-component system, cell cycle sensor histidine kinase and response regulator CckA
MDPVPPTGALILVVEDESIVRRVIVRKLTRLGYQVVEAASGQEALDKFHSATKVPALVITDVIMPDMGGKALVGKIQESAPTTRILYMSGYAKENLLARGILEPNDEFLEKIEAHTSLPDRVQNLLRS